MKSKLVSIIIPCYNVEKYLANCFISLQNLKYDNIEIVFINGASTDKTTELVHQFCSHNKMAKYVDKPDGGVSAARNAGIDIANGDYIFFYDSDDILNCNIINHLVETLENTKSELSIVWNKKIHEKRFNINKLISAKKIKNNIKFYNNVDTFSLMINDYKIFTSIWNKLYITKIIKDNNIRFNEKCFIGEDTFFNLSYLKQISKIAISENFLYYYLQRKTSIIHQNFKETRLSVYEAYDNYIQNFDDDFNSYIHLMRLFSSVETLYFIKKSNYSNYNNIAMLLDYLKQDMPYLKKCKRVKLYRKLFIPLIPCVSKLLLRKRLKQPKIKKALTQM